MDISAGFIGGLSAAVAVPIVFSVLRKLNVYKQLPQPNFSLDELNKKYKKWGTISGLMLITIAGIIGFGCWLALCTLEEFRASFLGEADFVLTPIRVFYGVPSIFFGIFLASIPTKNILIKVLGMQNYAEFLQYQDQKSGVNSARVFKHVVYVIAPVLIIAVALSYQNYATISKNYFLIHPYFALSEHVYEWSDVKKITNTKVFKAPNGRVVRNKPYFTIEMRDGVSLNFHNSLLEIPFSEQEKIAEFAATQSNQSINIVDTCD